MRRLSPPSTSDREVAANKDVPLFPENERAGDAQPQLSSKKGGEEEIIRRHGFF
jgi:hypothetical protein